METKKDKEFSHYIMIPFTGLGLMNGFRGQDWFDYRAQIFKDYTLKSFANQTCKDFTLWISFRPEEKDNPTTKKIEQYIKDAGVKYVFTFDGLMFYDDRAPEKNATWEQRLEKSLKVIGGQDSSDKYVYLTIFGSDDMFREDAVELIQKQEPEVRKALYNRKGYVYDVVNKRLADWYNPYCIGNYTLIYPHYAFYNAKQHILYQDKLTTHEEVPKLFDAVELGEDLYCCCVHGKNISTLWQHDFKGREYYYDDEKKELLAKFGIKL